MAASASDESGDLTHTVARHYNELQEAGKHARKESRIFYLRNFNNWIKSILIGDTIKKIREESSKKELVVMDLCSGKGGDLLKWKKGGITRLVCADIAGTSVEQCENRYKEMVERGRRDRYPQPIYDAEFITADCTKVRLLEQLQDPSMRFDLVSCQFSFHYSFESHTQADMMLRNACERLRPGGYFIGTTPNSYELVRRLQDSDGYSFGNDVYRVTFPEGTKSDFQLFGAKYDFHLEGVVDCPEFLVYFPALEKMAERYGMKLIMLKPFAQYFEAVRGEWDNVKLLNNMQGMEAFPPDEGATLMGEEEEYQHARDFLSKVSQSQTEDDHRRHRNPKIGTLSKAEWEATTIYLAFVFKKLGAPPSASTIQSQMVPTSSTLPRKRKHSEDD